MFRRDRDAFVDTTYSKPHHQWPGFAYTAYRLDWDRVAPMSLQVVGLMERGSYGTAQQITIGDLQRQLVQTGIARFDLLLDEIELADGTKLTVSGPSFARRLFLFFVRSRIAGYFVSDVQLYFVEEDHCMKEHMRSFSFFVVSRGEIVEERVSFVDDDTSGFDPEIFQRTDEQDYIWRSERLDDHARTKWFYRKFLRDTSTGQLIALRGDRPALYDDSGEAWASAFIAPLRADIYRLERLLRWTLILLALATVVVLLK